MSGSVPVQIALHPTHHSYSKFKKHGNPPLNLLPINQLPLLILNQAVGNYRTTTVHPQPLPPPNHYNSYIEGNVGNYQQQQQLAQYLDNLYEIEYQPPTTEENVCPHCQSINVIKWGKDRKKCKGCGKTFRENQ